MNKEMKAWRSLIRDAFPRTENDLIENCASLIFISNFGWSLSLSPSLFLSLSLSNGQNDAHPESRRL
jgi:hypothetical protein